MSEYQCSVCNRYKHCSELVERKINGIECLVCEDCVEYNEVDRYLEQEAKGNEN